MKPDQQYDIFLSHAGQEKRHFVDCLYQLLINRGGILCEQRAFMDEHSLKPGDPDPWLTIVKAAEHCKAAVVVLSPSFVRKEDPMKELKLLLDRWTGEAGDLILLPVFMGLSVEDCLDLQRWYSRNPWPEELPRVEQTTLEEWAALVERLPLENTGSRLEQTSGFQGVLATRVADEVIERLVEVGKLPTSLSRKDGAALEANRMVLRLPSQHLVGRQEEILQVMAGLCSRAGAVVLVGPPGEGKTTVAVHAALTLCERGWFPGGAFQVDLSGFKKANTVPHFLATRLAEALQRAKGLLNRPSEPQWKQTAEWLEYDAEGPVLLVLENTEDMLCHPRAAQALRDLLEEEVQQFGVGKQRRVRLVVNSRINPELHLDGARRIHLGCLHPRDALQLLQEHAGMQWPLVSERERSQLVAMCQGNPLSLIITASFISQKRCTAKAVLEQYTGSRSIANIFRGSTQSASAMLRRHRVHIQWLLSMLSPTEQEAVGLLSLYAASFDAAGAAAVICSAGLSFKPDAPAGSCRTGASSHSVQDSVQQLVQQLEHLSVLQLHSGASEAASSSAAGRKEARYKMHLLVKELASELRHWLFLGPLLRLALCCCLCLLLAAVAAGFHAFATCALALSVAYPGKLVWGHCRQHRAKLAEKHYVWWMLQDPKGPGRRLMELHQAGDVEACQQITAEESANLMEAARLVDGVVASFKRAHAPKAAELLKRAVDVVFNTLVQFLRMVPEGSTITCRQAQEDAVKLLGLGLGEQHPVTCRARQSLAGLPLAERYVSPITPRELRWVKPLGSGSFGLVSLCKYLNAPRAVKVLTAADKGVEWNPKVLKSLTWHERILIPSEHGTSSSGDPMYLASYAQNHDLSILLERGSSLQRLVKIATEVAEGMNYLHSKQPVIAHLDLKPANVLLTRDYQAKIADLGMAAVLSDNQMVSVQPGTLLYAAPELLRADAFLQPAAPAAGPAGQPQGNDMLMITKADVFSFGIMLYEMMLSLCRPRVNLLDAYEHTAEELNALHLAAKSNFFQMFRTHYPDARPSYPLPDNVPTAIKQLIDSCWAPDPQMRPSFQQIHDRLQLARQSLRHLPVDPPMAARDPRVPRMTSLVPAQVLLPAEAGLPLGAAAGQLPPAAGSSISGPESSDGWVSPFAPMALPLSTFVSADQLSPTYSSCSFFEISLLRQAFQEQAVEALHTAEQVNQMVNSRLAGVKVGRWLKQAVAQLPADWAYSNKELKHLAADMKAAVGAAHAKGFEVFDEVQWAYSVEECESRVAILDLLPLTWTATDWLIGAWGALVLRSKREQPVQAAGVVGVGAEHVKQVSRQRLLAAVGMAAVLQVLAPEDAGDIRSVLLEGKEEMVALHEVLEGLHALVRAPEEEPEDVPFFENELVERRLREEKERKRELEAREAKLSSEWLTQYNEKRLPEGIEFLRGLKEQLGGRYPDALFLPPTVDQDTKDRAFQIMRDSWTLWDEIEKQHSLGTISDEFFRRDMYWVGRGQECRELVEPVDIANWYMKNKQWQYKEMYNCVEAGYHYAAGIDNETAEMSVDNDRRPTRYMLLQRLEKEVFHFCRAPLRTVEIARRFERAFGNRKWEDVLADQGKQQGQAQHGSTIGDIRAVSDQEQELQ